MSAAELIALPDRLRAEPRESEWLEFKAKRHEPQVLGEYLSALANSACLQGKPRGYLVFGIEDGSHAVVGTAFDPQADKGKGEQLLPLWLSLGLHPNVGFEIHPFTYHGARVVLFEVHPAFDRPVKFYGTAYIRDGTSKTELSKYPEKERVIWNRRVDWSAQVCEQATLDDLDPQALEKARREFTAKFPAKAEALAAWDDATFLNKAKLSIRGAVTNAALLLLGRAESSGLLAPAVARISWLLKNERNEELDYEHFGPPFLLNVDKVLARIRNLTVRELPEGTLVAGRVAAAVGQKAQHIRNRGFDSQYYRDMIVALVREHQPVAREDIDRLLLDKLPEVLTAAQKLNRIHNLLRTLAEAGVIVNEGSRRWPKWVLADGERRPGESIGTNRNER